MQITKNLAALNEYRHLSNQKALVAPKADAGVAASQGNGTAESGPVQAAGSQTQDNVSVTSQAASNQGATGTGAGASVTYDPWTSARESESYRQAHSKTTAELSVITVRKDFGTGISAYQGGGGQIADVNLADETSKLHSLQGLNQAGAASLKQANTVQQSVLNLIG